MIEKVYLDSSFLIALLVENHVFHKRAVALLTRKSNNNYYISALVVDECVYVLHKHLSNKQLVADGLANAIRESAVNVINIEWSLNRIEKFLNYWKKTSLHSHDAMHVYVMKNNKIKTIATFDQDFQKIQNELAIKVLS